MFLIIIILLLFIIAILLVLDCLDLDVEIKNTKPPLNKNRKPKFKVKRIVEKVCSEYVDTFPLYDANIDIWSIDQSLFFWKKNVLEIDFNWVFRSTRYVFKLKDIPDLVAYLYQKQILVVCDEERIDLIMKVYPDFFDGLNLIIK